MHRACCCGNWYQVGACPAAPFGPEGPISAQIAGPAGLNFYDPVSVDDGSTVVCYAVRSIARRSQWPGLPVIPADQLTFGTPFPTSIDVTFSGVATCCLPVGSVSASATISTLNGTWTLPRLTNLGTCLARYVIAAGSPGDPGYDITGPVVNWRLYATANCSGAVTTERTQEYPLIVELVRDNYCRIRVFFLDVSISGSLPYFGTAINQLFDGDISGSSFTDFPLLGEAVLNVPRTCPTSGWATGGGSGVVIATP